MKPLSIVLWKFKWYLISSAEKKVRLLFQLNGTQRVAGVSWASFLVLSFRHV